MRRSHPLAWSTGLLVFFSPANSFLSGVWKGNFRVCSDKFLKFLSKEGISLTFSAKWSRRAASWPLDLVTLFFSILACSSLSAWENAQRFRLPSVGGHKRLLRAGEQNASQQKTLEGGRRSYPNS